MKDYQKRMVEEYKELNTKIDKLTIFLSKEDIQKEITATQITLMKSQLFSMMSYSSILLLRLQLEEDIPTIEYEPSITPPHRSGTVIGHSASTSPPLRRS